MSTRCQIDFINKYQDGEDSRRVYRHSDGYPDTKHGVIEDLKEFLKWNKGRNGDLEYQVANFILWSKLSHIQDLSHEENPEPSVTELLNPTEESRRNELIGYGICGDDFHGDIEFFYEVINKDENGEFKIEIKVYKVPYPFEGKEDFKLIETVEV